MGGRKRKVAHLLFETHLFLQSFGGGPFNGQLGFVRLLGVHFGQAKVADFGHAVVRNQNVSSRQVSVDQLLGLQVLHPLAHVTEHRHADRGPQCSFYVLLLNVLHTAITTRLTERSGAAERS